MSVHASGFLMRNKKLASYKTSYVFDKLCEEYIRVITGPGSRVRFATVCKLKIDAQSAYEKTMLF